MSLAKLPQFLGSVNPLLKIALSIALTACAFALKSVWANVLLVGVLLVLTFVSVRVEAKSVVGVGAFLLIFTALTGTLSGDWGYAGLGAARLLVLILPALLLPATTAPGDLVRAFQAVRLPPFLVLSLMLTWRFLPVIQQEAQRIIEANLLRGVDLARRPGLWFSGLFTPLIFRIVSYADDVTVGLETRGYDPESPRSTSQPLRWRPGDTLFALGAAALLIAVGGLEWTA
ncbi:MAG: energy-coupling factor transporter transmembrane protein EcfT [Aphanocapsa lilacina HA4352-LM1]|jgi:energy-coupling factor transport system permease protein|nr:energy-coupling factor transporter transmembrane protein EcfT [Aphanocapsa lilacina HA4352-LM1]